MNTNKSPAVLAVEPDRRPGPSVAAILGIVGATLCGCTIHHMRAYVPGATAPETADAATASTNCFEASTVAEQLSCATPSLQAQNRTLTETLQSRLRDADIFSRDALLATQRAWLIALPSVCHLPQAGTVPPPGAALCLAQQYQTQTAIFAAWHPPAGQQQSPNPIAQYVRFLPSAGAAALDTPFCAALAQSANQALSRTGTMDPAAMPGAAEIAGSHGAATGSQAGHHYAVELGAANAFGGFQQRARALGIDGTQVLTSVSLGALLQQSAANNGARFSAYASQTGDYGAADIFSYQGRTLAILEDTWGFNTPATPGEFAHAGVWDLAATPPAPLCLYDTFQMPPENGAFDALPSFTPFRDALIQIRASVPPAIGIGPLRDQSQLRNETDWLVLNMPLVVTGQAASGGWTNWLRHRHDDVLDALFAWSTSDPSHKPLFDRAFALLRPAAADLVQAYQQTQALSGVEAKQAAGLAIMELLYGATINVAPSLGADLRAPASATGIKPRYPILAAPS